MLLSVAAVGDALNPQSLRPLLGCDESDGRWIWLEQLASPPPLGTQQQVLQRLAFPVPPSLSSSEALRLAALLPAWRLVQASEVKLGSTLFVSHPVWPAKEVLQLSRRAGARWRALGAGAAPLEAEFTVPFNDPAEAARSLPERPDAVIVLAGGGTSIGAACSVCRDMGVVVVAPVLSSVFDLDLYPDVHRRGLRLKLLSWSPQSGDAREALEAIAEGAADVPRVSEARL